MTALRFVLCDVFTDQPLSGQGLTVFTRATNLSDEQMQALARELNSSETAFVQPPARGGHAKVRVFDAHGEVLHPRHAALGTAVVLGVALQAEEVRIETHAGITLVRLEREGARIVFGWSEQAIPTRAPFEAGHALFDALRLAESAPPDVYEGEFKQVLVAASSVGALTRVVPDQQALARLGIDRISVFAGEAGAYQMRVFEPLADRFEAPVTPAAAGQLAWHLVNNEREPSDSSLRIEVAAGAGRSALIYARIQGGAESAPAIWVGGSAVVVGRGDMLI